MPFQSPSRVLKLPQGISRVRILLITPPNRINSGEYSNSLRENLGLGYLASMLRKNGHDVSVINFEIANYSEKELERAIRLNTPQMIGVSLPFSEDSKNYIHIIEIIRSFSPKNTHITVGGHAPTIGYEDLLSLLSKASKIDSIILGEGEYTILELAARLSRNKEWQDISGLCLTHNNEVKINNPPSLISDLDILPFPARDDLLANKERMGNIDEIYISSSRGCYGHCSFCSVASFYGISEGNAWRARSVENTIAEIQLLIDKFGNDKIYCFVDDNFIGLKTIGKHRALNIAKEILKRRLDIKFEITCRANDIDQELFSLLKESGLHGVYVGIESWVPRVLKLFQKDITVEQNKRAIEILSHLGIICDFGFIMFEPSMTLEEIEANINHLREIHNIYKQYIHPISLIQSLKIYPSTKISHVFSTNGKGVTNYHSIYSSAQYDYQVALLRRLIEVIWRESILDKFIWAERIFNKSKNITDYIDVSFILNNNGESATYTPFFTTIEKLRDWHSNISLLIIEIFEQLISLIKKEKNFKEFDSNKLNYFVNKVQTRITEYNNSLLIRDLKDNFNPLWHDICDFLNPC